MLVLGVTGFGLLFIAYVLSLFAVLDQESVVFNILNFAGAALIAYFIYSEGMVYIALLPSAWAIIAVYYMIGHKIPHKGKHNSQRHNNH
ncbi:MAG: hypothetical protein R6U32_05990 [Candidatus Woesearchaeota archaeon]